jgi:23S rRNA (guanosine2251-2'-O)-methyltransferase
VATIIGFHAVAEALRAGRPLDRVSVASGASGSRVQQILALCRDRKVPVRYDSRDLLDRISGGSVHQGIVAVGADRHYAGLEDIDREARLIVVLDGIEDPHNLGAILRTAHAAGASAVVIPERRAVGLTPASLKSAAGAAEHLPVVRVGNVNRALETLKEKGFWIYGLDERGEESYDTVEYTPPTVLVIGAEGKGLHAQVKKHCDRLVRIPLVGQLSSLNASVASGIALFEWKRRFSDNRN